MSESVITVENLSKRYLIGHRQGEQGQYGYAALRDIIAREAHNFARKAAALFRGEQIVQGDEVEEFWALKNVSFDVKQGEIVGILGRNGAGKSTLLKVLSRIIDPTEGRALVRGRVASLLEIGTGFHPELTGRENIFLNGSILGMSQREIQQKFDTIVAFAQVEKFLDTPIKHYSSGMYLRLAFAVAAHLDPEILIIDEVLAVGDNEFQKKCLGKMSEVAQAGRTILFVSHNTAAIRALCTHAIVMRDGKASAKCDVMTALEQYSIGTSNDLTTCWKRPPGLAKPSVHFTSIDVRVEGKQPKLRLDCTALIMFEIAERAAFIAVDFLNKDSATIMQAVPRWDPFIGGQPGIYRVDLSIELPPLIPGVYSLEFWIGPLPYEIYDWIRPAVQVEILDGPDPSRICLHHIAHGSIVPPSSAVVHSLR
jgi:homopolymeric O-antigen transport system ATP-binding protein